MRIINSLTPYYQHKSVHFLEWNKEYSIDAAENGLLGNYDLTSKALYNQSIPEKTRQKILNSGLKNRSMAAVIYLLNTESWHLIIKGEYDLVIDNFKEYFGFITYRLSNKTSAYSNIISNYGLALYLSGNENQAKKVWEGNLRNAISTDTKLFLILLDYKSNQNMALEKINHFCAAGYNNFDLGQGLNQLSQSTDPKLQEFVNCAKELLNANTPEETLDSTFQNDLDEEDSEDDEEFEDEDEDD
jgi:hypothetical protein